MYIMKAQYSANRSIETTRKGRMNMTGMEWRTKTGESPQEAYRALIKEYGGYVYAIAFNKLRSMCSKEEVDECVSDVFAEIFMKCDAETIGQRDLKGYIGTVAKRRAIDYFRKAAIQRNSFVPLEDEITGEITSEHNVESDADKKELRLILLSKITELGEPDAEIIMRKYYYNQNSDEIARRLSLKASTVRSRCKRALERLSTMLAEVGISM